MTKIISNAEIKMLAGEVINLISAGRDSEALNLLKPILDTKCPFNKLDLLGKEIGQAVAEKHDEFLNAFDRIIGYNAMGGFVVVGRALTCFAENDLEGVMLKSREYIIKGDKWYVCDIIGERILEQALVDYFDKTLPWLERFLEDDDKWVRRSAGVAIHFFSKRVTDDQETTKKLLNLIEPHIEEKQIDAVKGIGWGLKTIGKHHPEILVKFLKDRLKEKKKISRVMMRKAVTYLDKDKGKEVENYV